MSSRNPDLATCIREIAASIVQRSDGRILLLKRAPTHTTNPGKWCFVTGYVESRENPQEAASRELIEELGIRAKTVREGNRIMVHLRAGGCLSVHPFLFLTGDISVKLDREHVEYAWIAPRDLYLYDFVQQLDEDLAAVGLL